MEQAALSPTFAFLTVEAALFALLLMAQHLRGSWYKTLKNTEFTGETGGGVERTTINEQPTSGRTWRVELEKTHGGEEKEGPHK